MRRGHIVQNPARVAKPPRVEEVDIVPFTVQEAQRLFKAAATMRNGARFIVALALGLRRGEALGLRWPDIGLTWEHGCPERATCRTTHTATECAQRRVTGTLTVRRAIQQRVWKHGCWPEKPCGRQHGSQCPKRHSGGLVVAEVKSRAGRRVVGLPTPVIEALKFIDCAKPLNVRQPRIYGKKAIGYSPTALVARYIPQRTIAPGSHYWQQPRCATLGCTTRAIPQQPCFLC